MTIASIQVGPGQWILKEPSRGRVWGSDLALKSLASPTRLNQVELALRTRGPLVAGVLGRVTPGASGSIVPLTSHSVT